MLRELVCHSCSWICIVGWAMSQEGTCHVDRSCLNWSVLQVRQQLTGDRQACQCCAASNSSPTDRLAACAEDAQATHKFGLCTAAVHPQQPAEQNSTCCAVQAVACILTLLPRPLAPLACAQPLIVRAHAQVAAKKPATATKKAAAKPASAKKPAASAQAQALHCCHTISHYASAHCDTPAHMRAATDRACVCAGGRQEARHGHKEGCREARFCQEAGSQEGDSREEARDQEGGCQAEISHQGEGRAQGTPLLLAAGCLLSFSQQAAC